MCDDKEFGKAVSGSRARIPCANNEEGEKSALCSITTYTEIRDTCILQPIKELLDQSEVTYINCHVLFSSLYCGKCTLEINHNITYFKEFRKFT